MRLAIAIVGLLGTLSAQVICRPVDAKSDVDLSLLESKKITGTDYKLPLNSDLSTGYPSRPVRCFEHLHGTFALNSGKIVHDFWVEDKLFEQWMSGTALCSVSQSRNPFLRFSKGLHEQGPETESKRVTIPAEFCRASRSSLGDRE